ncbi:MAG: hypothetical protein AAGF26_20370 [Cyanobacteria bacterium P01_G01_bin.49]
MGVTLGYTDGRIDGQQVPVFLLRSPWTQFCIWAATSDLIVPGGVLVTTDDSQWSLESHWKAYSLVSGNPNEKFTKNLARKGYSRRQSQTKSMTSMTNLAAEIATKEVKKESHSSRAMSSVN